MKNIKTGMWMMLCDDYIEGNVMVKVLSVDENNRTANVYIDLAARKTDEAKPYETEVSIDYLKIPTLKIKKNKKRVEK